MSPLLPEATNQQPLYISIVTGGEKSLNQQHILLIDNSNSFTKISLVGIYECFFSIWYAPVEKLPKGTTGFGDKTKCYPFFLSLSNHYEPHCIFYGKAWELFFYADRSTKKHLLTFYITFCMTWSWIEPMISDKPGKHSTPRPPMPIRMLSRLTSIKDVPCGLFCAFWGFTYDLNVLFTIY